MSWDAKAFDKPLILLEFKTVSDAIAKNAYKPDADLEKHMSGNPSSELYLRRLAEAGLLKEACDFLCYAIDRRAGVWWGCLRVKDLAEEKVKWKDRKPPLQQKQEAAMAKVACMVQDAKARSERSKAAIEAYNAKMAELQNDLRTKTFTDPADPRTKIQESIKRKLPVDVVAELSKQVDAAVAALPPERKARLEAGLARIDEYFVAKHGKPYKELVRSLIESSLKAPEPPSGPTPMDIAERKLKADMAEIKAGIDEQMSIFPLKIPGLPKAPSQASSDAAYAAALRWVMAPTNINARLACEAGLAAGLKVEGLLAKTAFWSGSNLAPANAKMQVAPPPGLAAKGLLNTLFKCAMSTGGALSYDDRYKLHLKAGIEIAQAINLWDEEFGKQLAVHDRSAFDGLERPHRSAQAPDGQEGAGLPPPPIAAGEAEPPWPALDSSATKRERLPGSLSIMLENEEKASSKKAKRGMATGETDGNGKELR